MYVRTTTATNIIVERYENWKHPVLKVLKKHSTGLYKVHYSKDGKYPIFCVRLRGDPQITINDHELGKLYLDTLKANFDYPYAFVDKKYGTGHGIRVNVHWIDEGKTQFRRVIDLSAPISLCDIND